MAVDARFNKTWDENESSPAKALLRVVVVVVVLIVLVDV